MKKSTLGMAMFRVGALGYLTISIINQIFALLIEQLFIPYIVFIALGLSGLSICLYEVFIKKE